MATVRWNPDNIAINSATGAQIAPAVADNGGVEFGVAWINAADGSISVNFFDEQGLPSAARTPAVVTDGVYAGTSAPATASDVQINAGGGLGYGVVWEEAAAGQPTVVRFRYIGAAGTFGPEVSVSSSLGVGQHDAALAGYSLDDPTGRPNVDGYSVVWVESNSGPHSLGDIVFQRVAVTLDRHKDPTNAPAAAGLDGRPPADAANGDLNAQVTIAASGRDPSVATAADGSTVITWIDATNHIHLRALSPAAAVATDITLPGAVTATQGQQHALALAGGEIAVAWVAVNGADQVLNWQVFSPGAAVGTFTPGPIQTGQDVPDAAAFDFTMAALPDGGGFAVSWNADDAGHSAIVTRSFTAGGVPVDPTATVFHAADATNVAATGLIGDRFVTVYQDNATPGDPSNIAAQIFDTRTQANGAAIVLDGPGITLIGDPVGGGGGGGAVGALDVLVGSIGNDIIDGRLNDDILDGGLGNDRILAGAGNDVIDGGGNGNVVLAGGALPDGTPLATGGDTIVFTGRFSLDGDSSNDDYSISFEGNDLFTVTDLRAGSPDGVDVVRNVENFEFQASSTTFSAAELAGQRPDVTPTAWGLTRSSLGSTGSDLSPALEKVPDTDGFLVNDGPTSQPGTQAHPVIADSIGEFVGILWENDPDGDGITHIRGQFLDVLANPDTGTPLPNAVNVTDGIGDEFNAAIVSGGANGGWGIAFEERDNALDTTSTIRTNFMGPGTLTGVEQSVLDEGPTVNQHDVALSGSFLDRTLADPVGGSALPKDMSDGYNVAWVSTDLSTPPTDARYGHIMLQRFEVPFDALGNPTAPVAGGIDGIAGLDSDAAVWVGDEANGIAGAIGRNPSTAALHGFETAVIWIESDGAGGERVAGRAYDDLGQVIPVPQFADISAGFPVAAGTNAYVVQAGAVNLGIAWITGNATDGYVVMGTMFSPTGAGLNGVGFGFLSPPQPFVLGALPPSFDPATADFHLTGISGEDSNDLVFSWNDAGDVKAQHIRTTLDPVTGVALSLTPEGNAVTVNVNTDGLQDQNGLAGLLSDRFITVYHDTSGITGDTAGDIVARVFDVREPGQLLEGDLVRNGAIQARADIIVGTTGNDTMVGDLLDNDGRNDQLYGGLGDDILRGGPDQSAGARVEIIDGGEGIDTAVYTGRFTDYSIALNGDGSFTIIDLRDSQDPATGAPLQNDGTDVLIGVEQLQFLGEPGAPIIPIGFNPPLAPLDATFDGTPVPWSLTDTSTFKEIVVAGAGTESQIAVAGLQTEAAMSWVSDASHIFGIRYEVQGDVDPLFSAVPVELTDGAAADSVADPFVVMAGGLGFLTTWESTTGGDTSIHMAFGSTATNTVFDPAAGFPAGGLASEQVGVAGDDATVAEDTVVGSNVAGTISVDPTAQGYEIVDVNNDTLEFGFHVAYVQKASAADVVGDIKLARYDIPVYDVDPLTGAIVTDANGNPTPSVDFGAGAETQPISIGNDGVRGTADDTAAISIGTGRDPSLGGLHDGQLVVAYVDAANHVQLQVYSPHTDEAADREERPGVAGSDIVARGLTTFEQLTTLPFPTDLGTVADGQKAYVATAQNGSFGVFWAADGVTAGTVDIKGIIYTFGGADNWVPSDVLTLETGLDASINFQVANTAVDPVGLEDGFLLTWQLNSGGIFEQRFSMAGDLVGHQTQIDNPSEVHLGQSLAPLEDGRLLIGFDSPTSGDVSAEFLDTRQPGVEIIGPRLGAPRDVLVGTVGGDNMTGGQLQDELYGGLGHDLLSGGSGADILVGGIGNDTLIGALGQDQLLGGDGDDLLWSGLNGPADPKVDRDLVTGLTAAGVDPNLIATEPGADIVSGGDGIDTLSFQGEFGRFNANLESGIVTSDRTASGSFVLEDVIGQIVDDGAGGTIFQFVLDVENLTGGLGDDTLIGSAGNNVLDGGAGTNIIDGAGGSDTLILNGNFADFLISFNSATQTFTLIDPAAPGGPLGLTDSVSNVELFSFADGVRTAAQLVPGPLAVNDTVTVNEDSSVTFDVRTNDSGTSLDVFAINGTSITAAGSPVALAHGQVALGLDGQLTYTPNANFFGLENFNYSVVDDLGRFATATASVTVNNVNDAPDDILFNGLTSPTLLLAENSPANTVVATLSTHDVDNTVVPGTDSFIYTLANNFGGAFKIVGNQIQVQNGALLDFEAAQHSFNLGVTVSDGHLGGTFSETVTVNLTNVDEAPVNVALSNASFAETAANGFTIGALSASDPEGTAVKYALSNDADGRFKIVFDSASGQYKLAVAENLLIDHQANDLNHTYAVQVRATDATGASSLQNFTVTATGVAENRITGTGNADTLNGTAGNDYINGGANKDNMAGGAGNDAYIVDNSGDKVSEQGNGGIDTIYTSLTSFDLSSAANVENLVFTGTASFSGKASNSASTIIGAAGADNLQGGNGNDVLEGRGGNDVLQGGGGNDTLVGGLGNDSLNGGAGNDSFVFAPGFGNDLIQSFGDVNNNQDTIEVSTAMFANFAALQTAMVQSGANVLITDAVGDVLTVQGTTIAALGSDDFRFF